MHWPILADQLDALARRLKRLSLAHIERAHETKSELAHEMHRLAGRLRAATRPQPSSGDNGDTRARG